MPAFIAPSKTFQRTWPQFVTVDITQAFAATRQASLGCFSNRRVGATSHIVRAQPRFVAPLDLRAFGHGPARNLQIRLVQLCLHHFRLLLVGPFHRLFSV
ncbi:MAG: hypothetical protein E5299_00085 [Burkholderia gladioli]|nr:MAG: hypothetical protein E5299_00085 [Burkholderia gladioli]